MCMPSRAGRLAVLLSAVALLLAGAVPVSARLATSTRAHTSSTSPAAAHALPAAGICRRMRAISGHLRIAGRRKRLRVLVTGDSMIQPLDQVLGIESPRGTTVLTSRHDGTGLTTNTVDWHALARRQAASIRPDATVISLGGRDGGIPLENASHHLVECCASEWLALYAARLRPLARAYLRGGAGHLYWLLLPAPRETLRAPLYEAINDALRLLAGEIGPAMHLIPVDSAISPGGFRETIAYDGLRIHPRTPDGIHLDHAGACVERSLVTEAMVADGLLSR
jgi:hypothetical protein